MEERQRQVSVINEAMMQMQRLHNIWLSCGVSKEKGNLEKYENFLRNAETELKYDAHLLSEDLDKNHESNYLTKLNNINLEILKCNRLILKSRMGFIVAATNKKWGILISKEELLREIQEESGKGGKRQSPEFDDDID